MNCPYCGSRLTKRSRCERCGEDVILFKKVYHTANQYYNAGLRKAQIRDLSGAVIDLKNCLRLNKKQSDARNLLGLLYYEMGETVSALSEWVLSKHFQNDDNIADHYINIVQESPSRLDAINQVIKRYNAALTAAKQGSDDLAVLQLKKVVNLNPHYIKALQLLALLYIHAGDMERAGKCLTRALKIDVANTTTLSYLEVVKADLGPVTQTEHRQTAGDTAGRDVIMPMRTYAEDKPNYMAFVNLVIGIGIGLAFMAFAIVPGIRKNAVQDNNAEIVELNDQMVKKEAALEESQAKVTELKDRVKDLKYKLENVEPEKADTKLYDAVLKSAAYYMQDKTREAVDALAGVDKDTIENKDMMEIYNLIAGETFEEESNVRFQEGHAKYTAGKYDEALALLEEALQLNPANVDAIYFSGRSYHRKGDTEQAKTYYNSLIENYPDSGRASEAKSRLKEMS